MGGAGETTAVNMNLLDYTSALPYLGRTVTYNKTKWTALYANARKAQKHWVVAAKVPRQMGEHRKSRNMLYKEVVQTVLLYWCESWVATFTMMAVLEGFHHSVARILAGTTERQGNGGDW